MAGVRFKWVQNGWMDLRVISAWEMLRHIVGLCSVRNPANKINTVPDSLCFCALLNRTNFTAQK